MKVEQKAETRGRLIISALTLFATKGYDATSVKEITALAGVSDRTFFLHFATKADAVIDIAAGGLLEEFRDRLLAYDQAASDLDALEESLISWHQAAGDQRENHHRTQLLERAGALSSTVRGKQLDANDAVVAVAAHALASRRKLAAPTLEMRLEAAVALRLLHGIVTEWATQGKPQDFTSIARSHFRAFRKALNIDEVAEHRRS